eukprot:SAG31_NODE_3903_length_3768_cov_2.589806_4_plen_153_part_00
MQRAQLTLLCLRRIRNTDVLFAPGVCFTQPTSQLVRRAGWPLLASTFCHDSAASGQASLLSDVCRRRDYPGANSSIDRTYSCRSCTKIKPNNCHDSDAFCFQCDAFCFQCDADIMLEYYHGRAPMAKFGTTIGDSWISINEFSSVPPSSPSM